MNPLTPGQRECLRTASLEGGVRFDNSYRFPMDAVLSLCARGLLVRDGELAKLTEQGEKTMLETARAGRWPEQ